MHDFLKKKKWMVWVMLLTFLFTSFMPSNVLAGNSVAEAAGSSAAEEDITRIKVQKTFVGLTQDQIESLENYKILVTNGTGESVAELRLQGQQSSNVERAIDAFTYTWTIFGLETGSYTIQEEGYRMGGYQTEVTMNDKRIENAGGIVIETITTLHSSMELTQNGYTTTCAGSPFSVIDAQFIVAKLTEHAGYFVWTRTAVTASQRQKVIDFINTKAGQSEGGYSPKATAENTYFYSGDKIEDVDGMAFREGTIKYVDNQLTFTGSKLWAMFCYGAYEITANDAEVAVINEYKLETVDKTIQKLWVDDNDKYGTRPDEITVKLQKRVEAEWVDVEGKTAVMQADGNGEWKYSFTGLDKYDENQHEIEYRVAENEVAGYMSEVVKVSDNVFNIVNTYNHAAQTSVHVEKVWNDFGNNVGDHPDITIELYQGALLYDTRTLSEGTLTADFANLPKYDANQEAYVYTVKEVPVSGYTSTVEAADGGFVITNTLQAAEVGKVTVGKTATGDNRPGDATTYKFELQIQVVQPEDSSVLGSMDQLTLKEANDTFKEADDAVEASMMMTTSASQYEYGLTEKVDLPDTQATAFMDIEYDSSSPSALQVFLNGSDTPSTLTFVENGETGDYYKVDFWLTSGANAVFDMQATSGSEIYYRIAESFDAETSANYSATSIFDATTGETMSDTAIDFTLFDADAAMAYTFTNVYTDNPSGGGPSGGGGGGSYDGPYFDDPTPSTPPTEIPDQDVPLAKPDMDRPIEINNPDVPLADVPGETVELEDSPVPLGDAPETGDRAPIGLLAGMLFMAAGGFVTVRRKSNE